jgi:hypothetical protein
VRALQGNIRQPVLIGDFGDDDAIGNFPEFHMITNRKFLIKFG